MQNVFFQSLVYLRNPLVVALCGWLVFRLVAFGWKTNRAIKKGRF